MPDSLKKTKIEINRLLAQKSALQHKIKDQESSKKKSANQEVNSARRGARFNLVIGDLQNRTR